MAKVDTEVCLASNCPFAVKKPVRMNGMTLPVGTCSRAAVMKRPKNEVCVSNVDITISKK